MKYIILSIVIALAFIAVPIFAGFVWVIIREAFKAGMETCELLSD